MNINILENDQLAVTTDSIVEEIEMGIYKDPYLIGWMTVMVNMSDLAAVAAAPVGILISEIITDFLDESFKTKLHEGINDACKECSTYVNWRRYKLWEAINNLCHSHWHNKK